jgi:hypothetical protein
VDGHSLQRKQMEHRLYKNGVHWTITQASRHMKQLAPIKLNRVTQVDGHGLRCTNIKRLDKSTADSASHEAARSYERCAGENMLQASA